MIKIALVGDVLITRPLPAKGYDGLKELTDLIDEHDVKFANLETTVHRREGYPSAFPGGTWAMTDPARLKDLKSLGFNILNTANNHSMDYSHNGLLATHKYLKENDLPYAGTGENLADATAPTFIECSEGRVALIGATSSFHDSDAAGNQSISMKGRPGVNPLRHKSVYKITEENYKSLQKIANEISINDYHNQAIKEGYLLPRDNFNFANFEFIKGENNILRTSPLEKDLERITKSIVEARKQSDFVIVSIHSHQFTDGDKKNPAEFIRIFAKSCIDAGASIIVGHGPHTIRGIEVYNKGVIFYGLGNFIFQNETVSHLPAEFYEKYSLQYDEGVGTAMDKRSKNGTIGLNIDQDAWNSILSSIEIDNTKMMIKLFPIELGYELKKYKRGLPKISKNERIIEHIKELSALFDTDVQNINGIGTLIVNR
jgi:poly-gamma-glutamate capsule biosynthesis protein CapA/YwtB (metallophosphatase superfamily)